jgi:DNA repair protein RadC
MPHRNTYIPRFRISLVRETRGTYTEQKLSSSADADRLLRPLLQNLDREHFIVIGLDAKNAVIGMNTVSIGSLTLAIVHPREVCKPLIHERRRFICAHNHPSGDATPSLEDRQLTTRLKQAADIIGIRMLDHVIIGESSHYSFADNGCLS